MHGYLLFRTTGRHNKIARPDISPASPNTKNPLLPGPANIGSSELSFRFQHGAAAIQRPASETNAFTTGYTESAVLFDECAIILVTKTFIKIVRCIYKSHVLFEN
jgi:hypothetical protein